MGILLRKGKDKDRKPKNSIIQKIVIPKHLYEKAVKIGYLAGTEVGFYMIGFVEGDTAYIIDLIEFPYSEKTSVSVATTIEGQAKIGAMTPLGLNVIGTMHKHPDGIGSSYSGTDRITYLEWACVTDKSAHVIFSRNGEDVSAYVIFNEDVKKIKVEISDKINLKVESFIVRLDTLMPLVIKKGSSDIKIRNIIDRDLGGKIIKRLSGFKLRERENIFVIETKPVVFLKLPGRENIIYEITCDEDVKTVGDLIRLVNKIFGLKEGYIAKVDGEEVPLDLSIDMLSFKTIYFEESPRALVDKIIEEKFMTLNDTIISLKKIVENAIKSFSNELNNLKEEITELREKLTEIEHAKEERMDLIEAIEERVRRLEAIQDNIWQRINDIENEIESARKSGEDVKEDVGEQGEVIKGKEREVEESEVMDEHSIDEENENELMKSE